jgi:hypothetical protein
MKRADLLVLLSITALLATAALVFYLVDRPAFLLFFQWPNGGIWSNIAASVILGVPAVYTVLRRMSHHHREHMDMLRKIHRNTTPE